MITAGKLEVTCKISELPTFSTDRKGWHEFHVNCDGVKIRVRVKPKVWKKLAEANQNWPIWVASITGKMGPQRQEGETILQGFDLLEPAIQVYEKKPKPLKEELPVAEN